MPEEPYTHDHCPCNLVTTVMSIWIKCSLLVPESHTIKLSAASWLAEAHCRSCTERVQGEIQVVGHCRARKENTTAAVHYLFPRKCSENKELYNSIFSIVHTLSDDYSIVNA